MQNNKMTDEQIIDAIGAERARLNNIIAAQNDEFRQSWGASLFTVPGRILFTPGVEAIGGHFMVSVMLAVMQDNGFTEENDPYGDHSFGCVEVEGQRLFWKIDLYDTGYQHGSELPHDPKVTRRVLTVMLPAEY